MSRPVHYLARAAAQPTEATLDIDTRRQGDQAAQRLFGAKRRQTIKLAVDTNIGDAACGIFVEPNLDGSKTDDAEIIRGEWSAEGEILFTHVAGKVSCRRCLAAMKDRRSA